MGNLLFKARDRGVEDLLIVSPQNSELKLIHFGRQTFPSVEGCRLTMDTAEHEMAIDILAGQVDVVVQRSSDTFSYDSVGGRDNVFAGKPTMVYVPRRCRFHVVPKTPGADVVMAWCPARRDTEPALITPDQVVTKVVGKDNWQREVHTVIGPNVDADRLLVGETFNPPGNWSSAPPHKHDVNKPGSEAYMEEVYFYLVDPPQGFGIQRVYSGEDSPVKVDDAYVVENGDTVALPYGYHPVVAGPGYRLMYFWVLAGENREYGAWSDDPAHAWLKNS